MTSPFVPMLFQGEEWGASSHFLYFTDHTDPELGQAVTEGRRREFAAFVGDPGDIPDPQARETFERSRLDWDEREQPRHAAILRWYQALIALRRTHPAFSDDRLDAIDAYFDETARWFVMHRPGLLVACNLHPDAQRLACPGTARSRLLLRSKAEIVIGQENLDLPGASVVIMEPGDPPGMSCQHPMSRE